MLGFGRRSYARRARVQNGARFVPTDLPGCVLFLWADRGITIATGVSTWADQSGNGNNFTQATGTAQPGYAAKGNSTGTGPALTFNPANSQLLTSATAILGNTNAHLFVVQKASAVNAAICSTGWGVTGGGKGWGTTIDDNATSLREITMPAVIVSTDGSATTNWEVWTVSADAGPNWILRVNGVNQTLSNPTSVPIAQGANSTIGSVNLVSQFWNGSIEGVIGYNRKLTAAEQTQVETYIRVRTAIF